MTTNFLKPALQIYTLITLVFTLSAGCTSKEPEQSETSRLSRDSLELQRQGKKIDPIIINMDSLPKPIRADSLPKTVTFDSKGIKTTKPELSAEQKKEMAAAYQSIIRNLAVVGIKVDSILEITDNGNTILAMQNNKKVTIKNVNGKYVLVN